jgi:energy-coupling factor transporter ATP-binding protein EcfA2
MTANAIQLNDLTYAYPRAERPALAGITLDVPAGQFCAVVGANGAGKSTLCYVLAGFMPQFFRGELTGQATAAGVDVAAAEVAELAGTVGLVFANPFNQITGARFTVREEIAFGLENLGVPREEMETRVAGIMALTGLTGVADRSPYALSGGQQQRLAIASVLIMDPQILVLDEPTSQLDPVGTREVFSVLHDLAATDDITIVLASHKLEWVAVYADRVIVLDNGRVVADGPPADILASPDLPGHGVRPTRYTQAAVAAQAAGAVDPGKRPLPVTLEQAIEFFQ